MGIFNEPLVQHVAMVTGGFIVGYLLGIATRIESLKWVKKHGKKGTKKQEK